MNVGFVDLPGGVLDELLSDSDIRSDKLSQLYTPSDVLGETVFKLRSSANEKMFACCNHIDDVRSVVSDRIAYYLQEYVVWNDCTVEFVANRIAGLIVKVDYN